MDEREQSLFRKEALQKISSPDQIIQLITVTMPRGWIALIGISILFSVLIGWSIYGKFQTINTSPGIIYPDSGGPVRISSAAQGTVTKIYPTLYKQVKVGDPLFEFENNHHRMLYAAPLSGRLLTHYVSEGQFFSQGAPLALLQPQKTDEDPLTAYVFVDPDEAKRIKVGMPALIALDQYNSAEYGFVKGTVVQVGRYPLGELGLMNQLQNEYLVNVMSKAGSPYEVLVKLNQSASDPTGYEWTSTSHPSDKLSAGTLCQSHIVIDEQPPIHFVLH
jgi:multidrug efflux pump subunit AcrA (membrane-fusion protein)